MSPPPGQTPCLPPHMYAHCGRAIPVDLLSASQEHRLILAAFCLEARVEVLVNVLRVAHVESGSEPQLEAQQES